MADMDASRANSKRLRNLYLRRFLAGAGIYVVVVVLLVIVELMFTLYFLWVYPFVH